MKWLVFVCSLFAACGAELRVAIIGLDSAHVVQFAQLLNDSGRPGRVPGARVTAAFKGGSPDVPASANWSTRSRNSAAERTPCCC